ncbi:MFS transporter [Streptosporangium lutulentum]
MCALSRAGLVALIAIPGIPLWILCVLVFVVQMIESPAKAAQMALLPDMLTGEAYSTGLAAIVLTGQIVSLVAFAAGGVLVGAIGTSGTLFLNAVAFALMALIIRWGLPHSPAARLTEPGDRWWPRFRDPDGGARLILGSPRLRSLLALALLAGFYVVPEVLAAPYAAELGLGTAEVGLLMAVMPVGNVVGVFLITRFVPPT